MYSLTLQPTADEKDYLIAELWDAGTTGITETDTALKAFFEDVLPQEAIAERFADFRPVLEAQEDRNWVQETEDQWQPFSVGERFFLVPEWRNDPAPPGRLRLETYPGMAAGTGIHPATQLCLRALEHLPLQGQSVIDAGTGSGILIAGANLLGAGRMAACDIDPEAAEIAARNLRGLGEACGVFAGSLRSVRSATFDVIVANLNAATLRESKADLLRVAAPDGVLLLAGFRVDEAQAIERLIGVEKQAQIEQDGWACLVLRASKPVSLGPEDATAEQAHKGGHHSGYRHKSHHH